MKVLRPLSPILDSILFENILILAYIRILDLSSIIFYRDLTRDYYQYHNWIKSYNFYQFLNNFQSVLIPFTKRCTVDNAFNSFRPIFPIISNYRKILVIDRWQRINIVNHCLLFLKGSLILTIIFQYIYKFTMTIFNLF